MCPEATVPFCAKADSIRASAGPAVTDGEARSLPVLGNAPAKATIQSELTALTTALAAGNVTRARSAVDRARAAISSARQAAGFPGDAPDLDAIDLALIQIELALK